MIKQVTSNSKTNFALNGKFGSLLQLIPEKNTQVFKMFSGMRRPRVHRLMMLNFTAVLAVSRSSDVLLMTWSKAGAILGDTATLLKE